MSNISCWFEDIVTKHSNHIQEFFVFSEPTKEDLERLDLSDTNSKLVSIVTEKIEDEHKLYQYVFEYPSGVAVISFAKENDGFFDVFGYNCFDSQLLVNRAKDTNRIINITKSFLKRCESNKNCIEGEDHVQYSVLCESLRRLSGLEEYNKDFYLKNNMSIYHIEEEDEGTRSYENVEPNC